MRKREIQAAFALVLIGAVQAAMGQAIGVDWQTAGQTTATGDLNGTSVTMSSMGGSADPGAPVVIADWDMSGPAFAAAPLGASQESLDYAFDATWTASFDAPVTDLRLYARVWRGPNLGPPDPPAFEYQFDQPFTILSGFGNASVSGNTLMLPSTSFQDGIIEFSAPVSSVSVLSTNANSPSRQILTFGVVPAPGSLAVLGLAGLGACRRRR